MIKRRVAYFIAASFLSLAVCSGADAQEQLPREIPTISDETHGKLFELLFPLDALKAYGNEFVLVLRYSPSFQNHSQLVIVGREGKVHVTEYVLNGNLWYKANEILEQTGRDDPVEMAKTMGVRKREFDIPFALIQRWRRNLINSVAAALSPKKNEVVEDQSTVGTVLLDGTVYEMWDSSRNGKFHLSLYGSEVSKRIYSDESAFIRWMKVIWREMGKRK